MQPPRLTIARRFLTHLRASDPDTEVPDYGLVATARRPTPFLFSEANIERLLAAAQKVRPSDSLRPHTFTTLLGLLASTGVRVGEAVRLAVSDVQLSAAPPRLLVRHTKFDKSRPGRQRPQRQTLTFVDRFGTLIGSHEGVLAGARLTARRAVFERVALFGFIGSSAGIALYRVPDRNYPGKGIIRIRSWEECRCFPFGIGLGSLATLAGSPPADAGTRRGLF